MIDLHSHLDLYPDPKKIIEGIIERRMFVLSVTTTPSAWRGTYSLSKHYPRIKTALGLHPQIAHERAQELDLFDIFITETDYVGEIGLDGSPQYKTHYALQIKVFEHILNTCSNEGGKILSIHSRNSIKDVLKTLQKYPNSGIPVLHWYTGSVEQLHLAIEMGCWFSVGPTMLRSRKGQKLIQEIPRNKVITETDGPFTSEKKKALVPWDVDKAIQLLSKTWCCSPHEANDIVYTNFKRLVSLKPSFTPKI